MADIIPFRDRAGRESARLSVFIEGTRTHLSAGPLTLVAARIGTSEEWAWSAVSYLKASLTGTQGGTLGGKVEVSAAAIGILLGYVEELAGQLDIISPPDGPEAA